MGEWVCRCGCHFTLFFYVVLSLCCFVVMLLGGEGLFVSRCLLLNVILCVVVGVI